MGEPNTGTIGQIQLDAKQIAAIVLFSGVPSGTKPEEWVALADRESSYRPWIPSPSGKHWGIWQIGTFHVGTVPGAPTNKDEFRKWLLNPWNNFKAAKAVYAKQGWGAWEASHTPNMEHVNAVKDPSFVGVLDARDPGWGDVKETLGDIGEELIPDPLEAFFKIASDAAGWIGDRDNWVRVALVLGGGVLIIAAAGSLVAPAVLNRNRVEVSTSTEQESEK